MRSVVFTVALVVASPGLPQAVDTAQKLLTMAQVEELVTSRVESSGVVRTIEERGIDFFPTERFFSRLRIMRAGEALVDTLKTAMPPALSKTDLLRMVARGESGHEIERLIEQHGISFSPTEEDLDTLRIAGASAKLVEALRKAPMYTPPIPTFKPTPGYTPEALRTKVQGILVLKVLIDARGNVAEVGEVSTPLGKGLDDSAIKTVRTWKFKPATRGGLPVSVHTKVEISFSTS